MNSSESDAERAEKSAADPPPLTEAQKQRIKRSPVHVTLRHGTYGLLAVAFTGATANMTTLVLGAVWARYILQQDRWFIFHYTIAAFFSALWMGYSVLLWWHVRFGGYPDQIKVDIGWIMMANTFGSLFQLYIYYKMRTYGLPDIFDLACSSGCGAKLEFVKLSPLILAISSLVLGMIQLFLCLRVYKSPLVQIPLDSHGMPMIQDPETGKPLPIGPDGKPILPAWLRPQVAPTQRVHRQSEPPQRTRSSRTSRTRVSKLADLSGSSSSAPDSETEMRPVAREWADSSEKETGRGQRSSSGRASGRR